MSLNWRGNPNTILSGYDSSGQRVAMVTLDPGSNGRYAGWLESDPLQRQLRSDDIEDVKSFLESRIQQDNRNGCEG